MSDSRSTRLPTTTRSRVAVLLALALTGGSLLTAGAASAAETLVVDDDKVQCADAAFATITAAEQAAQNGDTIQVCAGTYLERVRTAKNLTFSGPQAGNDAREGRTDLAQEAVVGNADGALLAEGNTGAVKVDGFTFTGSDVAQDTAAIGLISAGGHTVQNNVFAATHRALFFGGNDVTVQHNRFVDNTQDAVFIGSGEGDRATITENRFVNPGSAIVTVPGPGKTDGLVFSRNTQTGGGNASVLFDTAGALVSGNSITGTSGSVIYIGGGNTDTTVTGNRVTNSSGTAVTVLTGFGRPGNNGVSVVGNVLRGNLRGVAVAADGALVAPEVHFNEIVGNTKAVTNGQNAGVRNNGSVPVNAENNWWGCNTGPNTAGCDTVIGTGTTDFDPWLVLTARLADSTLDKGQATPLSGDLLTNSAGATPTGGSAYPDGGVVSFTGGALATAAPTTDTLQDRAAQSTLTAGQDTGSSEATASYDNATDGAAYTVLEDLTASVNDVSKAEGNPGAVNRTPFVFTVTLNRASEQAETVAYRTVDGSAEAGSDYDATSGTLTFAAGETSKTVTVPVVRDRTTEPNEAFTLELTDDGTSPASADGSGLGTIVNDDPKPRISAGDAGVAEGNAFTRPLRFPVRLDRASSTPVTVRFTTVDGSAVAPSDYTAKSGTVTFPAGSTLQFVNVAVKGDRLKESNETLTLNIFAPSGGTIADPNGTGVVRNDD